MEQARSSARGLADQPVPLRVAVICDFVEECWPSMDLIGEMLAASLGTECGREIQAELLRPALRRRFSQLPIVGGSAFPRNADRLMNRFSDYPQWLRRRVSNYEVFHLVDHSYSQLVHALPPDRTVVTCHDLDTFRCLLEPERERRPKWFREMTRRILAGFRSAAHVLAVSSATRDELLHYGLFPPERISVVPNGVHPSCSAQPHKPADSEAAELLGHVKEPYLLLSVGSTLPRKRVDVLLRVFAAVRQEVPGVHLVRVGDLTAEHRELARELGILDAISVFGFLTRDTLAAMYRRADLLLHPAVAEGFGLPLIEAMACGCPVLASDIPVLREVGGAAAAYCPAGDVPAWKTAAMTLLAEKSRQPGAWQTRRQLGMDRAAHFSWAENALATRMVYQKIMQQSGAVARAR